VELLLTEGVEDERDVPALLLRTEVRAELPLLTVPDELREVDELRPLTLDEERLPVLLLLFTFPDDEREVVPELFSEELLPELLLELRYSPFSRVVREDEALRVEAELRPEAADERKPALLRPEE
jgi:hypothetical protein